ncbi:MAG: hypothetical protein ACREFE_17065, partial [Limisphaerales bacterium]
WLSFGSLGSTSAFETMSIVIVSLVYTLLPMLVCIVGLAIAFHRSRTHPILQAATNFKRGHWLTLFFSLGIIVAGVIVFLFAGLLQYLDEHYFHSGEKLGPGFPFFILGIAVAGFGLFCLWLSAVFCLWRLLSALVSHVHSVQSRRAA